MIPSASWKVRVPTRVDLAGGTLDLWPLYLFLEQPTTVNLAIDLFAEASLELQQSLGQKKIFLKAYMIENGSQRCAETCFSLQDLEKDSVEIADKFLLHYSILRWILSERKKSGYSEINQDLYLTTSVQSPVGAGLGGSSALGLAILAVLWPWCQNKTEINCTEELKLKWFLIVQDLETRLLKIPAGQQDYLSALFGGLQEISWEIPTFQRYSLSKTIFSELESRMLLFYSGKSRNSGINNWSIYKNFLDQKIKIKEKMQIIAFIAKKLSLALSQGDWQAVASAIDEEWQVRKTLAKYVTIQQMDEALEEASEIARVVGKVCGAGGGGCFFVFFPDKSDTVEFLKTKKQVEKVFLDHQFQLLEFRVAEEGLAWVESHC